MSRPRLVVGNLNYSSWSLRPWLLMRAAGVEFDTELVPLDTPEFAQRIASLSPSRRVPALHHDGLLVWDSLAICEYVNETWLEGAGWPSDRAQRALARSAVAEMHSGFAALRSECPMNVRKRMDHAHTLSAQAKADVARVLELWRTLREHGRQHGTFLAGRFGIVDAFYAPVAMRFRSYAVAVDDTARHWMDALFALPAVKEWEQLARDEGHALPKYDAIGA